MSANRLLALFCLVILALPAAAQPTADTSWWIDIPDSYWVSSNITYSVGNNYACKLDVYAHRGSGGPAPTVIYIHGGGWVVGNKEDGVLRILPWIQMGFSVVNVEYRLAKVSLAPAAVEDCRAALRWVIRNAKTYGFDTSRIVVTGGSAGGHLALMTGMLNAEAGFDAPLEWDQNPPPLHVAAIVNYFGITDVKAMLAGPERQQYAISWIGSQPNPEKLAERVSPVTYVRKGLPPILTIHGDKDDLVAYDQAKRLHKALTAAGVPNKLITIPGGGHGGFKRDDVVMIDKSIREFLKLYHILP